jgi:hypothetical protein
MKIRLAFTDSAALRASRLDADPESFAALLDASVQAGDRISLGGGPADDFAVIRRRIVIEDGRATLVLTLDHPARG